MINISDYEVFDKLGEGTYAKVHFGKHCVTGDGVAIKFIHIEHEEEGPSCSVIRELDILKRCNHPAIVSFKGAAIKDKRIIIVIEYMKTNLFNMIFNPKISLAPALVKSYAFQLLSGLYYLHSHHIIHRDICPKNLLLDEEGRLKICDFGISRSFSLPIGKLTGGVITPIYRPPEIFLKQGNDSYYDISADIWSAGCVIAEMVNRKFLFYSDSELGIVLKIFETFGKPSEEIMEMYPKLVELPLENFPVIENPKFVDTDNEYLKDLVSKMLCLNPNKRITAKEALYHPYFDDFPQTIKEMYMAD